jgi:uncharacterized YigZ family protein
MTPTRYPNPPSTARAEHIVVNSRFIATIGEARTVQDAKAFIDAVRSEFSDATHNVFAYICGYGPSTTEGMSDDGEPSGTAGRPALTVLRGSGLGDVVVVITRYFGGTKLGTGGLVRAYTQSAQAALEVLPRAERVELRRGLLEIPYPIYERAKLLVDACGGRIETEEFGTAVVLTLEFAVDLMARFEADLQELTAGKIEVLWDG